jgi:glycosyltransferase involved in cell wall biosynthesis
MTEGASIPISVVLPTWNRAHLVHKAIDSVLAQTYRDFELVVVNDGSTDDTAAALARYGDRIRVVHRENGGPSQSRNSGVEAARHDWVAFLDDDDEFDPEMLAAHAAGVRAHPDIVVHATNTCVISSKGERTNLFRMRGLAEQGHLGRIERPLVWVLRGCFFNQAVMARRQSLLDVGLYVRTLYEDLDMLSRLALVGPWGVDDRELVQLYRRADGVYSVSEQWAATPVPNNAALVAILDRAAHDPRVDAEERKVLRGMLSRQRFSLGEAYVQAGEPRLARQSFVRSIKDAPGPRSFAKAVLPAAFGGTGLRMWRAIERAEKTTTRGTEGF